MKLKIVIKGPKVHDVGYRPYLAEKALDLSPRGFDVYNDEVEGEQVVVALIESDERRVRRFVEIAQKERPPLAVVHDVKIEDYDEDIMPAWQSATTTIVKQFNKAVPILQSVSDDVKELNRGMNTLSNGVKEINEGIKGLDNTLKGVKEDTSSMLEKQDETIEVLSDMDEKMDRMLVRQDETTEAVKDLQMVGSKIGRIEQEIKAIKTKIGAR